MGEMLVPARRRTVTVDVGGVRIGSSGPIVVQSMTNTDTADPDATAIQVARLAHAGSQLVRVTVNTEAAAAAVPEMARKLADLGEGRRNNDNSGRHGDPGAENDPTIDVFKRPRLPAGLRCAG